MTIDQLHTPITNSQSVTEKTYTWPNGNQRITFTYTGNVVDGKRHGKGRLVGSNGDTYQGDFEDDEITGKGIYRWADGQSYEGDVTNGRQSGRGIFTWVNGNKYEGTFDNGDIINKGLFTSVNGSAQPVDFDSQKYYYLTGLAGKIESLAANLSNLVDEWLNGKDTIPSHEKIAKVVIGHLLKPISLVLDTVVSALSSHFAEKIDLKRYQKSFADWGANFSPTNGTTRELYINQLIRAKVCYNNYIATQKDPFIKNVDLMEFLSGAGLQDTVKREQLLALIETMHQDAAMKRNWLFKNTIISRDTKEGSSENKVIFKINKNESINLNSTHPNENDDHHEYSIHIENELKNCTAVEFHINEKIKKLPQEISLQLIELLQDVRPSRYKCLDFVNSMHGKFKLLAYFCHDDWTFIKSKKKYTIGDVVILCDNTNPIGYNKYTFRGDHYAMYIGSKIFMSLYGGLPIVFSTMDQMQKAYPTPETLVINPV